VDVDEAAADLKAGDLVLGGIGSNGAATRIERIASSSRTFDPEPRTSSTEINAPLRAILKSRVSSPWIPAAAASYGYCHTSSIFA